ncbi:hypothetical protein [Patiriisocius sp. Uisw_017]|jgi:hypothetical protein|uniref:hypothetical protein n=1 Tax=Patiriisocius sp. Uisw_017 TaxID=3230968 RepID=UPI0039ED60D8
MKQTLLTYFLFFNISAIIAQESPPIERSFLDQTEFKVGYTGNLIWNNGLQLGAEYLLKEKVKIKVKKRGPKTIINQWLIDGNFGVTTNFSSRTDTGVFANFGLMWRRTNKKGKQLSIGLNPVGYYRSFLPQTYEVNGDDVNKVFLPGRNYYAPSLSIGIGRFRKGKKITGRYLNLNLRLRTHFNTTTLPAISLQYGFRFNFNKK